jgi:uncharacterized protein YwgA
VEILEGPLPSMTEGRQAIGRRELLLLLLGIDSPKQGGGGLGGITRLQKLLFLLEREEHVTPTGAGFTFEAYKAGPYSPKLYDDLEFLENLGLIGKKVAAEGTEAEAAEIDFTFENLIESDSEAPDAYEEYQYFLTQDGLKKIEQLLQSGAYKPLVEAIRRIKGRYGQYSLNDLLYHVYTKYPEMTTESEIKEKVLRRRPR